MPCRNSGGIEAVSVAGDETADDEMWEREGRSHKDRTDDHDRGAKEDGLPATQSIANPDARDCAAETADVV